MYEKAKRKRCQEKDMRMKNHLKTKQMSRQKVSKQSNSNRKRAQKKSVKGTGKKNGAKRKPCVKRKKVSRKEMPKDKDAKRKRRQRKAAEKTSVSRDTDDIRRTFSGEECVKSRASKLSTRRAVKIQKFRSKPDQEKVAASDKDGKRKKCQSRKGFKS